MHRPKLLALVAACALAPSLARANTPEDTLGLGARAIGLGGAGTATSDDFSGVYYNPASLGFCNNRGFSVALSHLSYGLDLEAQPDDPALEAPRDMTRMYIGFCTDLPYGLAFGMAFGTGFESPMTLDQTTLAPTPQFATYGEPLEQLTILLGLAWRIFDELAIGIGASVLINSFLVVDAAIPVADDEEVFAALHWELAPTIAPYVGARWSPTPELDFGIAYRGALFHDLEGNALVDVTLAGVLLEVDLLLESAGWYSPQQVAIGGAVAPIPALTIAADVTWYHHAIHPGPFVIASPANPDDPMSVAAALMYAPREDLGFRDTWVPRIGVEYRVAEPEIAVRGGYSFRDALVAHPSGRANLLDGPVHTVVLGAGYHAGGRREGPPNSAFGPMHGEHRDPEARAVHAGINADIDLFVRLAVMGTQHVMRTEPQPVLEDYTFGGTIFDVGLTTTVGWY